MKDSFKIVCENKKRHRIDEIESQKLNAKRYKMRKLINAEALGGVRAFKGSDDHNSDRRKEPSKRAGMKYPTAKTAMKENEALRLQSCDALVLYEHHAINGVGLKKTKRCAYPKCPLNIPGVSQHKPLTFCFKCKKPLCILDPRGQGTTCFFNYHTERSSKKRKIEESDSENDSSDDENELI